MAENATPTTQTQPEPRTSLSDGSEREQDRFVTSASAPATDQQSTDDRKEQEQDRRARQDLPQKRAIYLSLIGLFVGLFVAFSSREGRARRGARPPIGPFDVVLLALSTFRLARIVSFDQVTEPIRAPVTESEPGGGTEPKGRGVQRALGELVACPLCVGVWIAAALTYGLVLVPKPTRVFMTIFAAAGVAEMLNQLVTLADSANRVKQKILASDARSS